MAKGLQFGRLLFMFFISTEIRTLAHWKSLCPLFRAFALLWPETRRFNAWSVQNGEFGENKTLTGEEGRTMQARVKRSSASANMNGDSAIWGSANLGPAVFGAAILPLNSGEVDYSKSHTTPGMT